MGSPFQGALAWAKLHISRHDGGRGHALHRLLPAGRRQAWVLHPFENGQKLQLASFALDITAAQLFAGI